MGRVSGAVTERLSYFAGINTAAAATMGALQPFTAGGAEFLAGASYFAPYEDLAGPATGGGVGWAVTPKLTVKVAGFQSSNEVDEEAPDSQLARFEAGYRISGVEVRLGFGYMAQRGGALSSIAQGAFDAGQSSTSTYTSFSVAAPVTEKVTVFATYTDGMTDQSVSSALISGISNARANAFGVGVAARDVLRSGDGVTLLAGQPLRVASSRATVTVPTALQNGTVVTFDTQDIDLSAEAREIALEAVYTTPVAVQSTVSLGLFGRLNPDHDANAAPDLGIGAKFAHRF